MGNPLFDGQPVIVIHLEDEPAGCGRAACCGERFKTAAPEDHLGVPRVPCPGCMLRASAQ